LRVNAPFLLLPQCGKKPLRKTPFSYIIKLDKTQGAGWDPSPFFQSGKEFFVKLLIRQGRLVDPAGGIGGVMDILIENGKVAVIGSDLADSAEQYIDAHGLTVCAGLVDMHAHLREPGFEYRETVATGVQAAAAGGFTAVAAMPDTKPAIDCPQGVVFLLERSAQAGGAQILPVAALSKGCLGQEVNDYGALKAAGAVAVSDGAPVRSANLMRDAMILAHRQGLTVLACCEDPDLCQDFAVNEGRVSRHLRIPGRPAIAEELFVSREAMLAEETGAAVHICQVSTARSVAIIRRYKKKGVAITCETCPPYFTFTEEEVLNQGSSAKLEPPLRTSADVEAIIEGLKDGTIDAIASGHTPCAAEEKARPLPQAPAGMSALETTLAASLTALYHSGHMSLSDTLRKLTVNPALILRRPSKGRLSIGSDADLIIFDPDQPWVVAPERFLSKGRTTPFAGQTLKGRVKYALRGGELIYRDGGNDARPSAERS